jgi:hypothetical protein
MKKQRNARDVGMRLYAAPPRDAGVTNTISLWIIWRSLNVNTTPVFAPTVLNYIPESDKIVLCDLKESIYLCTHTRYHGRVARQRSAKPCTAVRIRLIPQIILNLLKFKRFFYFIFTPVESIVLITINSFIAMLSLPRILRSLISA